VDPQTPDRHPDHVRLARDIDRVCRLEGEFVVRSGAVVSEYFDKYLFESDPVLLRRVAEAMVPSCPPTPTCWAAWSSAACRSRR